MWTCRSHRLTDCRMTFLTCRCSGEEEREYQSNRHNFIEKDWEIKTRKAKLSKVRHGKQLWCSGRFAPCDSPLCAFLIVEGTGKVPVSFWPLWTEVIRGMVVVTSHLEAALVSGTLKRLGPFSSVYVGRSWQIVVSQSKRIEMVKSI